VRDAAAEMGFRPSTFTAVCPFMVEQILDLDYLPEDDR
jgi:hypothetical protein